MANSMTKAETIAFEAGFEVFENNNVFAKNSEIFKPDSGQAELAGQTIRVPYQNQISTQKGLDVSSGNSDVTDITVPLSLSSSDIYNGVFSLSALERNVESRITRNAQAAVRKISADISNDIRDVIIKKGTLVGAETTALTDYKHFAKAGVMCREVEAAAVDKFMYLGPRTELGLANELGMRQTDNSRDMKAYGMSELPSIGDFQTFSTNNMLTVSGSAASGITVAGASQGSTLIAYNSDGGYSAGEIDDPREQNLTLSSSALSVGDCFTIAGVNRIGIDSKQDTGQLMTFRVVGQAGTTSPLISPAIVATGPNQNVSAEPANGAAITVINTATSEPTAFTTRDALTLFCSDLDYAGLVGSAETSVAQATTSSGLQVAMVRQGKIDDLSVKYRFVTWCKPNMRDPLRAGIILPNQAAAI